MKWNIHASKGVVVAGGFGAGAGAHQLQKPVDILLSSDGALLVADLGNKRVTKWGVLPCIEL